MQSVNIYSTVQNGLSVRFGISAVTTMGANKDFSNWTEWRIITHRNVQCIIYSVSNELMLIDVNPFKKT